MGFFKSFFSGKEETPESEKKKNEQKFIHKDKNSDIL